MPSKEVIQDAAMSLLRMAAIEYDLFEEEDYHLIYDDLKGALEAVVRTTGADARFLTRYENLMQDREDRQRLADEIRPKKDEIEELMRAQVVLGFVCRHPDNAHCQDQIRNVAEYIRDFWETYLQVEVGDLFHNPDLDKTIQHIYPRPPVRERYPALKYEEQSFRNEWDLCTVYGIQHSLVQQQRIQHCSSFEDTFASLHRLKILCSLEKNQVLSFIPYCIYNGKPVQYRYQLLESLGLRVQQVQGSNVFTALGRMQAMRGYAGNGYPKYKPTFPSLQNCDFIRGCVPSVRELYAEVRADLGIKTRIREMGDWALDSVTAAIDDYIRENGRVPDEQELHEKNNLPYSFTIRYVSGMDAEEFCRQRLALQDSGHGQRPTELEQAMSM